MVTSGGFLAFVSILHQWVENAHFLGPMRTKCGLKDQKSPQCGPNASFADLFGNTGVTLPRQRSSRTLKTLSNCKGFYRVFSAVERFLYLRDFFYYFDRFFNLCLSDFLNKCFKDFKNRDLRDLCIVKEAPCKVQCLRCKLQCVRCNV